MSSVDRAKQYQAEALMHYEDAITARSNGESVAESVLLGTLATRLAEVELALVAHTPRAFVGPVASATAEYLRPADFTPTAAHTQPNVKLVIGDIKVMVYDADSDELLAYWFVSEHGGKETAIRKAEQWIYHNKMTVVDRREMGSLKSVR